MNTVVEIHPSRSFYTMSSNISPGSSQSNILFISGNHPTSKDTVTAVLRRRGHAVKSSRLSAIDLAHLVDYDLVILEIEASDPDSMAACAQLRQVSRVPVLLLIPPAVRSHGIRGLELGADSYVVIPFDRRELVARVEALMRRYVRPVADSA